MCIKRIVADNVVALRKQRGWSQEHLADESDLHRNQIGDIERAEVKTTIVTMEKLANGLKVPIGSLFEVRTP